MEWGARALARHKTWFNSLVYGALYLGDRTPAISTGPNFRSAVELAPAGKYWRKSNNVDARAKGERFFVLPNSLGACPLLDKQVSSFPRRRESRAAGAVVAVWIPACAGMTVEV